MFKIWIEGIVKPYLTMCYYFLMGFNGNSDYKCLYIDGNRG